MGRNQFEGEAIMASPSSLLCSCRKKLTTKTMTNHCRRTAVSWCKSASNSRMTAGRPCKSDSYSRHRTAELPCRFANYSRRRGAGRRSRFDKNSHTAAARRCRFD